MGCYGATIEIKRGFAETGARNYQPCTHLRLKVSTVSMDGMDGVDEAWAEHRAMAGGCASCTEGGTPTCLYPEALGGRSATVEASESDVAVLLVRLEVR